MTDYPIKRSAQRIKVEVPVALEHGTGMTRDISMSGIYLKTSEAFAPGDRVKFTFELEFAVPEGPLQFGCEGRVIRVEKLGNEYGIASTIDEMISLH